jgi:hypothetical protein
MPRACGVPTLTDRQPSGAARGARWLKKSLGGPPRRSTIGGLLQGVEALLANHGSLRPQLLNKSEN